MEMTFAAITPRSLATSRTGGIVARLLCQPGLDFVGARMMAPSDDFVDAYMRILERETIPTRYKAAYMAYLEADLRPAGNAQRGYTNRLMLFFFQGKKAQRIMKEMIGDHAPSPSGATIRGTYGDYTESSDGSIHDFHPAVLTSYSTEGNREMLRLFADYLESDGGVIEGAIPQLPGVKHETTLVMIKPDNLDHPSPLPGNIIDLFGTTGLFLVGARLVRMSVDDGMEFYGFLEDIFVDKLAHVVEESLRRSLSRTFDFALEDEDFARMTDVLKRKHAHGELCKIIHYMTGVHPDHVERPSQGRDPGPAKCLALLYRGENAVQKIRDKLGATDPKKAKAGTVRSDYGHDLMHNGAHASDSVASAERERKIVGLVGGEPSSERRAILAWLRGPGGDTAVTKKRSTAKRKRKAKA